MSQSHIPAALRERVATAAHFRCGYCQTARAIIGQPLHIEHIVPLAAGGQTSEDNLWLACPLCNGHKGTQTDALDPVTGERVPLFNPRKQNWHDHFAWSDNGAIILGVTPIGRATIFALHLNNEYVGPSRRIWIAAGWHPPKD